MLQQTRVDTVIGYYRRFLKRFPSIKQLAEADIEDVLKVWEGLGYYARAHNLHACARTIRDERGGRFPRTYEGLLKLPGVGPYTAAAIASLAYGLDHAVLDGNVLRVLARLMDCDDDISRSPTKKKFQGWVDGLLPSGHAGAFNEAIMELGATVCTPRNPQCRACPLKPVCRGQSRAAQLPVKKKKAPIPTVVVGAAVVRDEAGLILIARRKPKGLLGGLWEFPGGKVEPGETLLACAERELHEELGIRIRAGEKLLVVHHVYSHFRLEMHVFDARLRPRSPQPRAIDCDDFAWSAVADLRDRPFSKADLQVIAHLQNEAGDLFGVAGQR